MRQVVKPSPPGTPPPHLPISLNIQVKCVAAYLGRCIKLKTQATVVLQPQEKNRLPSRVFRGQKITKLDCRWYPSKPHP